MHQCGRILLNVVIVFAAVVSAGCSADRLILGENHETIDPGSARREVMQVDGRGGRMLDRAISQRQAHEPQALVLFFIGKGGRVEQWIEKVADAWGDKPVEFWGLNYPGSGGSEGPVTVARVGPDALALYDRVKEIAGSRPIFLQGGSFGTAVALCVAANRPVAGLILKNPPPLRELILGHYGWWNLWLIAGPVSRQVPADLDSLANAGRSTAPAVFVLSGNDEVIPPSYQQRVVDAYAGPKRIVAMPGAPHNSPLTHEAAIGVAEGQQWMWESARAGAGPRSERAAPK